MQAIWGDIWKFTVEKNQTNATSVTMHPLLQVIWGDIWRSTLEKSQTNATSVIMHPLGQAIWGHIWKRTVEKSQTNATCVIMQPLGQAIWGYIWKCTVEKRQTNATNVIMHLIKQAIWGHIWKSQWRKVEQMQPVWLCIRSGRHFEETFENARGRKIDQADAFNRIYVNINISFLLGVINRLPNQRGARDVITSVNESSWWLGKM